MEMEQKLVLAGCFGGIVDETAWTRQPTAVVLEPNPHLQ